MPRIQMHRQSDLEKKLKILESQLYGKRLDQTSNIQSQHPSSSIQHLTSISDITYLRQDLTKILILSSLAVGIQLVLYFSQIVSRVKLF